ncbi:MAG: DUF2809 domain-containing protein [Deltaproteobacteria bacterium]
MSTRLRVALALPVTIGVGLAARFLLPGAIANFLGVALWSGLVYLLVVFVRPTIRPVVAGIVTGSISLAVELFQLTEIPLALAKVSVLFRLALGTHFALDDLPGYAVGTIAAALVHFQLQRKAQPSPR